MWGSNNFHSHASPSGDGYSLIRSRSVCVRFLQNNCPYSALACHDKDDAMLCEAWKKGLCPHNRCLRRHYYLEKDRATQRREPLREMFLQFSSPLVVKVKTVTEKHRREEVDLETGRRRSWIETENKELIDITGEASPVAAPRKTLLRVEENGDTLYNRVAEEEALKKIMVEEEALKKKMVEEEALKKKMVEEEALKKKRVEEEALKKKMVEEEARKKQIAKEEALKKKLAEEEAWKKKMAEEEALQKKMAEEEARKMQIAKEDALKKKLAEEEALKNKIAEEEEAAQKKREMEIRESKRGETGQGSTNKCTDCGREFRGEKGVRSHLNHPRSKCGKYAANTRQEDMPASANSRQDEVCPALNINLDGTVYVTSDDES